MSSGKMKGQGFQNYVAGFKTVKLSSFTHTSMMNPKGSFYIPNVDEELFFKNYTNSMKKKENLHFTEKHRDICPILIDFDFRFNPSDVPNQERKYDHSFMLEILEIYIGELVKYVHCDEFEVYLMEKPSPVFDSNKNIIKDGVHIIINNVITRPSVQYILRNLMLEKLKYIEEKLQCKNTINDIFDEAVIEKNNWMMYGSCKPGCECYKVTKHWTFKVKDNESFDVINNELLSDDTEYVEKLSIRNKYFATKLKTDKTDEILNFEEIIETKLKKQVAVGNKIQQTENKMKNESDQYEIAKQLILMLDSKRADDYQNWIRVGWCARNIDHRLLDEWIEFSKNSNKYNDGECRDLWNRMKHSGLGIGTLCMWAKQDNLEMYNQIVSQNLYSSLLNSGSDDDYDIACVIYDKFKQDFICSSIKHKIWYEFKNHRWKMCEDGYVLKNKMSTEMVKEYYKIAADFAAKAASTDDKDDQDRFSNKNKVFTKIAHKLKKTDFKDKMLKECASMFYVEKFEERLLDTNTNLIGFENGVYDLEHLEFREGHPEDYISYTTGIDFVEYDEDNPIVHEIMDFMKKVLPKKDLREYMLTLMSSMLDGNNKEEKFYIWTGHGSNGKSKCIELLEKAIGDYACAFNVSLLMNKRVGSSQTNSELVRAKGKRFAVLQEPEEGEKMNAGFMKELSGNDKIIARGLYKEPIEFKPMFKMVLTCNHLPILPADDGGTWRRVRLIEFKSHFCEKPNPENENEFAIDRELAFKFDDWKETFMSLLIRYYKDYKENGIYEPEDVLRCTKDYQKTNDSLAEFITDFIKPKDDGILSLNELYDELKQWHQNEGFGGKPMKKANLSTYLNKHLKTKPYKKGSEVFWSGYVLKLSLTGSDNVFEDEDDDLEK